MNNKICNRCGVSKNLDCFFNDRHCADGKYSICKECKTETTMKWREKNKDHYNTYMRTKNRENYPKDRLRRYGITVEQHAVMKTEQNDLCAICNKPQLGKRPLVVDHDHSTGKARGLLCYGCNRLMVLLDNPELLHKATAYKNKFDKI